MKKIKAEIEYINENGMSIHSDIEPPQCGFDKIDDTYRKFLHDVLDEWLDKSDGSGGFYIKAAEHEFY